ncbi:hypothetical protein [Pseudoalteromonas ostreae]|uniref:hypothetical protein n=1 Tax=Pseudoalteromonas ostreae TaxID=2774154 RepID=UPI0023AB3ED3|nr:hypothetical protein [Pseudoalteromonas ostreae]
MQLKLLLMSLSILAASGCGGSSNDSQDTAVTEQTFTLKITANSVAAGLEVLWMDNKAKLTVDKAIELSATAETFLQPTLLAIPKSISCDTQLSNATTLNYSLAIQCVSSQATFEQTSPYSYPVTIRYGEQNIQLKDSVLSVPPFTMTEPEITALGGPQICEIDDSSALNFKVACRPYTVVYEKRKLYLVFSEQEKQLLFDNPDKERLIESEYLWFDEQVWFITEGASTQYKLHSASFDNGQLGNYKVHDINASSLAISGGKLFALTSFTDGVYSWQSGKWKAVSNLINDGVLKSEFIANNQDLYLALEDNNEVSSKSYIQIINAQIRGRTVLSKQISTFSHTPFFEYDDITFGLGFGTDEQLLINVMDVIPSARDDAVFSLNNVRNATIWQNANNQFLFTNQDSGIEQFKFTREQVETSTAFDLTALRQTTPDWIGGDLDTLLAGDFVETASIKYAVLKYLRKADIEQSELQLQTRLNTTQPIRVYNETWRTIASYARSNTKKITPIVSEHGYLLVYVGDASSNQSIGQLWALSADKEYLIKDDVSWEGYLMKDFHFEAVSEKHLVVYSEIANKIITITLD